MIYPQVKLNIAWILFQCILFSLFLGSMQPWFFWEIKHILTILTGFVCLLTVVSHPDYFSLQRAHFPSLFLLTILILLQARTCNINGFLSLLGYELIVGSVILLNDDLKIKMLHFQTNAFAVLLLISMVAFVLHLFGVPFPSSLYTTPDQWYSFDNYYFFMISYVGNFFIPRFSSVFLEPGHVGMITSLMVVANKFDFRRLGVIILFIASILSFSLAAYLLLIIGVLLFMISSRSALKVIFISLAFGIFYVGVKSYNDGDNQVNQQIFQRLIFDQEKGIEGNNRYTLDYEAYYDNFMNSDDRYIGLGNNYVHNVFSGGNSGAKVFIIQNGIIGLLILGLMYLSFLNKYRKKGCYILLIIYSLSFIQRPYALWESQILIFIVAMPFLATNKISYK